MFSVSGLVSLNVLSLAIIILANLPEARFPSQTVTFPAAKTRREFQHKRRGFK
ncbi:MAG: hypothetical protein ABJA66_01350 [Actinomycetota bacterium]